MKIPMPETHKVSPTFLLHWLKMLILKTRDWYKIEFSKNLQGFQGKQNISWNNSHSVRLVTAGISKAEVRDIGGSDYFLESG